MTIRRILNGFSVVLTVLSVILGAWFIFTSFADLSLYRVPIVLNLISFTVAARFIFIILNIILPIFDFLKKWVRIFAVVLLAVIVLICFVFGFSAYTGYCSFRQSCNTSLFNRADSVDAQVMEILPYYDMLDVSDTETPFYSVTKESTKQCTQITVSNKVTSDEMSAPSYSVYYFKSNNMALILKFTLEEYFGDFIKANFERMLTEEKSDVNIKFYTNEDGYSAVVWNWRYICYFRLADIDKNQITFENFSKTIPDQINLLKLLDQGENIPGAQHIYSVKENSSVN